MRLPVVLLCLLAMGVAYGPASSSALAAAADIPAPTILSSTPASPANNNSPTLNGTAASLAVVTIYAGSGCSGAVAATGPADLAGNFALQVSVPDDSTVTFSANATDGTTTSPCSGDFTYVEDSTPPAAPTLGGHPASITNNTTPSFSFSGENGATFQCRLGSDPFSACSSPKGYTLGQGTYTFEVRAVDAAGNVGASSAFTWTIDTTPPPAPTITAAPNSASNDTAPSFSFTDAEPGVTFHCRLTSGAFPQCTSPKTYTLGAGTYTFFVKAIDAAGNESPATSRTWTIDTTPPTTALQDPKPPALTTSRSASFSFTGSDSGTGLAGFQCRLDDASTFTACTSPAGYGNLADGSHTFRVRAVDAAGNVDGSPETYTWTVDGTPPLRPVIDARPGNPDGNRTTTFTFHDSEPVTFHCQVDGNPVVTCGSGSSTGSYTTPSLSDGVHTFSVNATDAAGNTSETETFTWTIDTVNPLVTITDGPAQLTNQRTAAFSFSANKPNSTSECQLDGGAFAACTSPQQYSALADGAHVFAVRATTLGHTGPVVAYGWTVDATAPQTTIGAAPPAASTSASATFVFFSSEDQSTFTCRLDGGGVTPCTSPTTYSGLGNGQHTFSVEATDRAGNTDASPAVYAWTISGVGPPTQDLRPPANVRNVKRNVGYGRLQLHWLNPSDPDFDHVAIFAATKRSTPPRTVVYTGRSQTYTDKRFKNGQYYRYLIVSYDHAKNAAGGTGVTIPPSVLLKGPGDGKVVHRPPLLRWTSVRGATFYNVQLYFRGRKVLSIWPAKPRQQLTRRWTYGGRVSLAKGPYAWFVWPGFGLRTKSHYGHLLGQGSFIVR